MRRAWAAWVRIWDAREAPHVLALVRILVASVVLWDLCVVMELDLVPAIFGPLEDGGLGNPLGRKKVPLMYEWLPPTAQTAFLATWVAIAAAAMLWMGLGTRLAALVLAVVWAQLAQVLPPADRAIDMLLRNVLVVLAMSGCGRAWSVDARLKTGRWGGDGGCIPAWPRMLLVIQLLLLYSTAGIQKVGMSWTPLGDFSALYVVLRDPTFAVILPETLDRFYGVTRFATAATWLWEWATPLAALAWWYRATRTRGGRLRAWMNSHDFWVKWVMAGVLFQVGTAMFMRLGIFPAGMLCLYPVFFHPDEWRRLVEKVRRRLQTQKAPGRSAAGGNLETGS